MIRNKYLTFLGMGLLFMASACNDGYEKEPVEHFTLDYLFSKADSAGIQARYFLNNIYYEHLPSGYNRINGDFWMRLRTTLYLLIITNLKSINYSWDGIRRCPV